MNNKFLSSIFLFLLILINPYLFTKEIELVDISNSWDSDAQNYNSYLRGSFNYISGNFNSALVEFEKLESKEKSIYFYDMFIRFLFSINRFSRIVSLHEKLQAKFKNNVDIQKIFAQAYFYVGKEVTADLYLDKLTKKYPDDLQLLYFRATSLIKSGKLDKALDFVKKCIKNKNLESKHFLFYFLASKIYMQKNMIKDSLKFVNKSLELFPDFEKGWLLKSVIKEQQGQAKEAITGYKRFLNIVGHDESVEKELVRLLFVEKRFKEATDILEKIKSKTPSQKFDLALINWRIGKHKYALEVLNKIIKGNSKFEPAKFLKIEILVSTNHKKEALDFLKIWLEKEPNNIGLLKVLLLLRRAGVNRNSIINVLISINKVKSTEAVISALIDLYFEKYDYKKVLFYCKKLFKITKDLSLKSKILFQTAYIHFANGNKSKVENILLKALKYKPVYPSLYNLLAYVYAQKNKNLEVALRYVNLALKKSPNLYYYIDTKGYILFKMGKIKDAIHLFERALSFNSNDEEVLKHLNLAKNLENN